MRWLAVSLLFCIHCVGDTSVAQDGGADASTSDVAMSDAPVVDTSADAQGDAACTADVQSDPKNCGSCGHDCVGGLCSGGACQVATLVTGQAAVSSLAATQTKLFWARNSTTTQHGGVFSSDLDGQNLAMLYDAGANNSCSSLQVTSTTTYFYCAGEIYACALPSCAQSPTPLLAMTSVAATALDETNQRLYFAVYTPYNQQAGGFVGSFPLAGGPSTRLVAADQPSPSSLLIAGGLVYWLDAGTYTNDNITGNGGVRSAPLGTNQISTDLVNDKSAADYSGIAFSGSTIYFGVGSGNAIHSVATIGGSASTYTSSANGELAVLVADKNAVYWAESGSNAKIQRCQLVSCPQPMALATGQNTPYTMTQDAISIFWANYSGGEIRRLAK